MAEASEFKRVAFSPREFAQLFGKSQTWGYRQIYAGKVKAITVHGRILIPAAEVDAILKTAGIFDGTKPKVVKTKNEIQALASQFPHAWRSFLAARRQLTPSKKPLTQLSVAKWPFAPTEREAAMERLLQRKK